MNELIPPPGKVIIRKDEPVAVTASGILLRPNDRAKSNSGTIVAGAGLKPGEKIIFIPRVSSTVNFRGENLVIISDEDILGTYD